jgi:eukaryotic-like serine/threonine-protein kinase
VNGTPGERYEVGDVLGRGRSAVHRGVDRRLGRQVALKHVVLDDDDVRARTLREARATARLVTPHVVALYDVVEEPDAIWLVMELVEAPSLLRLVDDCGPLDDATAARVGLGVLAGLEAAHAAGIVHRDVKPANILVGAGDDGETVKLADFGVAAWRDDAGLTEPGMIIGSPSYMAPEQATAGLVGPAADLWGLGAALYFAREGEPPFAGTTAMAAAVAVVRDAPRPQRRPGRLSPLIDALLAKDPARRPSPAQVRSVLEAIARGAEPAHLPAAGAAATDAVVRGAGAAGFPAELPAFPDGDAVTTVATGAVAPAGPNRSRRRRTRPRALLAAAAAVAVAGLSGFWLTGSGGEPPAGTQPAVADTAPAAPAAPAGTAAPTGASASGPTAGQEPAADGSEEITVADPVPAPDAAAPPAVPAGSRGASGPGSSGPSGGSSGQSGGSPATTSPPTTAPATTVPTTVPDDPDTTVPDTTTPTTDPAVP